MAGSVRLPAGTDKPYWSAARRAPGGPLSGRARHWRRPLELPQQRRALSPGRCRPGGRSPARPAPRWSICTRRRNASGPWPTRWARPRGPNSPSPGSARRIDLAGHSQRPAGTSQLCDVHTQALPNRMRW